MKFVERRSVAFADHALAVHQPHLDALVRHGNPEKKFSIVMNAPDPRFFARRSAAPSPSDRFVLLYHGTISRRHGLENAVRAVEIARRTYDDIQLEIVGDGDDVERLSSLVDELDLRDAVEIQQGTAAHRAAEADLRSRVGRHRPDRRQRVHVLHVAREAARVRCARHPGNLIVDAYDPRLLRRDNGVVLPCGRRG